MRVLEPPAEGAEADANYTESVEKYPGSVVWLRESEVLGTTVRISLQLQITSPRAPCSDLLVQISLGWGVSR